MTDFRINVIVDPRAAKTGLRSVERGLGRVEKQARSTGSVLKSSLAVAGIATAALAIRGTVSLLADFGQEMSTVGAISRATGEDFLRLTEEATRLGISTRFSAVEAAQGMTFLARAGFDADQVLGSVSDTLLLAQAGALGLAEAADIASNVLQGFRLAVDQTARVVDVLALAANSSNTNVSQLGQAMKFVAPVAAGLGVTVEETAAAIGALSNAGLQASMAGTGLRRVLAELESPSDTTAGILASMGLTVDEVRVSTVGLTGALTALSRAGVDTGLALEIFGQRGGPAFEVMSTSIPAIIRMTDELGEAEGTAKRVADAMDDNLNGALLSVRSAFQGLVLAMGDAGGSDALEGSLRGLAGTIRFLATAMDAMVSALLVAGGAFVALKLVPVIAGFVALDAAVASGTVVLLGSAEASRQQAAALIASTTADIAKTTAALAGVVAEQARAEVLAGSSAVITVQNTLFKEKLALEAALTGQTAALATAQVALGAATKKAAIEATFFSRTFARLGRVIAAHPIGAVVVALGALTAGIVAFIPEVESASDKTERFRNSLVDLGSSVDQLEGLRAEAELLGKIGGSAAEFESNIRSQIRTIENATTTLLKKAKGGVVTVDIGDLITILPDAPQEVIDAFIAQGQQARDEALKAIGETDAVEQGFFDMLFGIDTAEIELTAATRVQGNVDVAAAVELLTAVLTKQRAALEELEAIPKDDPARIAALGEVADSLVLEERLLGLNASARERAMAQIKIEEGLRKKQIALAPDERSALKTRLENLQALTDQSDVLDGIRVPQEEFARTQAALNALQEAGTISAQEYTAALADAKDTLGGFDQLIASMTAEVDHERRLVALTRAEREVANEVLRAEQQLRRELSPAERETLENLVREKMALEDMAQSRQDLLGGTEAMARAQEALNALMREGIITAEQYTEAMNFLAGQMAATENTMKGGFKAGVETVRKDLGDVAGFTSGAVVRAFGAAEDAMVQFATTGELNFSKFVEGVLADFARLLARKALMALLSAFSPGAAAGSAASQSLASNPDAQHMSGYAAGGSPPTNANIMVGEEGPEIFHTPSQAGTIVPAGETAAILQAAMTPETPIVNTTVEVNPTIVNVEDPDAVPAAIERGIADQAIINRLGRHRRAVKGVLG